jgi:hypothetical protein
MASCQWLTIVCELSTYSLHERMWILLALVCMYDTISTSSQVYFANSYYILISAIYVPYQCLCFKLA